MLQGCLFSSNENSICGSGAQEFQRFNAYNANDSLISVTIVNSMGDTINLAHYEYDSNGKLRREIEISGLNQKDTSCIAYEAAPNSSKVRGYVCSDSNETFSVSNIDNLGRVSSIQYYLGDTAIFNELYNTYDSLGNLVKVEIVKNGVVSRKQITSYNSQGKWLETSEYDGNSQILNRTTNEVISQTSSKSVVYDSSGNVLRWEIVYTSKNGKEEKAISCKES